MKVTVLNGSPKGKFSTTLHSVLYLRKRFPEDSFEIVEIASRLNAVEKDIHSVVKAMEDADLILFSYPVYTFIAPYQLHRFIELLKESGAGFEGKFCAQITTSKHFYDVTAQKYIEENAADLGMKYIRGFYADMDDLLTKDGQCQLDSFWQYVHYRFDVEMSGKMRYEVHPVINHDIALVTDMKDDTVLEEMINEFISCCSAPVRIVNISDFPFKGGCVSCFNCASDGTCIYKDGFSDFLKDNVYSASAIVYAFTVKDHSMGSRFKLYDDRQFCNGHRMMTIGTPVGYLVNGDIDSEPNLKMILEARAEVGRNMLCRIVSSSSDRKDIARLADELAFAVEHKTLMPQNFFGVGGTKIFRDLIWLMRGLMRADHKFYKEHGIYDDFPQRHIGKLLQIKLIGFLFNNRKIRRKMGGKMSEGMIAPYSKVVENTQEYRK